MNRKQQQIEIGKHLSELVLAKYDTQSDFCKDWLKEEHIIVTDSDDPELTKRRNKFSQIKCGNKGIQIEDLPIICKLLDTTCNDLLCGKNDIPMDSSRLTNYIVASSDDVKVWDAYINHKDGLILRDDEYGNTVLDYAIRFKNLAFIHHLIYRGIIWFDSKNQEDLNYSSYFGAGTNIPRKEGFEYIEDCLKSQVIDKNFRMKLIELAIDKHDLVLLEELKANAIPDYYSPTFKYWYYELRSSTNYQQSEKLKKYGKGIDGYFSKDIIRKIGRSSDAIVAYFTEPIKIEIHKNKGNNEKVDTYEYMYLYISKVLEELINNNHSYAETAVRTAIKYNEETYRLLKEQIDKALAYKEEYGELSVKQIIDDSLYYDKTLNIVRYQSRYYKMNGCINVVRNIACVGGKPKDVILKYLVEELNTSYQKIMHIKDEYITE